MRRCLCAPTKANQNELLLERLHELARSRNTLAAIETKNAMDERALAEDALRIGDRKQAKIHLEAAALSEERAKHELALYKNAVGMIRCIDKAEIQKHMGTLFKDGTENVQKLIEETPELEDYMETLVLPDVPNRPLEEQRVPLLA